MPLSISDLDRSGIVEASISLSHPIHHGERLRECSPRHTYIPLTQLSSISQPMAHPLAAS